MTKEEFVMQYVLARASHKDELNPVLAAEAGARAWDMIKSQYGKSNFPVSRCESVEKKNG